LTDEINKEVLLQSLDDSFNECLEFNVSDDEYISEEVIIYESLLIPTIIHDKT